MSVDGGCGRQEFKHPHHPDDVVEPLSDPFRTLFPNEYCRLGGQAWDAPLTLLPMWGKGACGCGTGGAGIPTPGAA